VNLMGALDGRVELRGLLGEGGMGQVHRAWDRGLERAVAVKFVRGHDARDAERLLLEARLQARVDHPHVVKVHEVGTLEERPCILLQLVEGRTLAALAPDLALAQRVDLVRQAATGIHAAHLQGLVHRDVKPGNVLVERGDDGSWLARVTDFGLARGEEAGLTRTGLPPGTLDYMSPEQLVGPGPVDFRSDVYALGATLYAVLADAPPFRTPTPEAAGAEDQMQLVRRILEEEPTPLLRLRPGLPRDLPVIAARAMEKDPAARYQSAEAFAEELGRFGRGEPIRARPASATERLLKWTRRNRLATRALTAAALSLLAGGGLALWTSRRSAFEAQEANRLGALASSFEYRVRLEHLSPPHDLRPAQDALLAEIEALRLAAANDRTGPASVALGRGLELLGDLDGARSAYEAAWAVGFRSARAAEGLGMALGRVYQREHRRAVETLEPAAREERIAALRRQLLAPALDYLALGDASGWRGPYLRAVAASLDDEHAAVQALVAQAAAVDASQYQVRLLGAESWIRQADLHLAASQLAEALAAYQNAGAVLSEALAWGRSDPGVFRALAELHDGKAQVLAAQARDPGEELGRARGWLDRGLALDARSPALLLEKAIHLQLVGRLAGWRGEDAQHPFEESELVLQRVIELDPTSVRARQKLAWAHRVRANLLRAARKPSLAVAREGLRIIEEAIRLAPMDPELRSDAASLHDEEGEAIHDRGEDAQDAFAAAVRQGEEALRLRVVEPGKVRLSMAGAELQLAREAWFGGRGPRPSLDRAGALAEEALAAKPGDWPTLVGALGVLALRAEYLGVLGVDSGPAQARALALADHSLASFPGRPAAAAWKAYVLLNEAIRRLDVGEEAAGAVEEATRWIGDDAAAPRSWTDGQNRRILALARGRLRASLGRDPRPELTRALAQFAELERAAPGDALALRVRLSCAVEAAAWPWRHGRPAGAEVRRGLAIAARALQAQPRDPKFWVAQARLQAFAGDREAGRTSLARAYAIQPLVRASREARAAEAEIGP